MENPRSDKVAIVDEVRDRIEGAEAVMVTEYRGLTVSALSELRSSLRPVGGRYKVYKNTLVRLAATDVADGFSELLVGPTALAFTEQTPEGETGDVVAVAKILKDFGKANPDLIVKGGIFEGNFMDASELGRLAEIEPREVLLAKLAGAIAAPMTTFAGLLQAVPRDFAYGLKALIDQGGAADAPEPSSEEAAAAPEPEAAPAAEEETPATDEAPAEETPAEEETPAAESAEEAPVAAAAEEATEESTEKNDAAEGDAPAPESEA